MFLGAHGLLLGVIYQEDENPVGVGYYSRLSIISRASAKLYNWVGKSIKFQKLVVCRAMAPFLPEYML